MEVLVEEVLENYEKATKDLVRTETDLEKVFKEEAAFLSYIKTIGQPLLEADREAYDAFFRIARREREVLLETEVVNDGKALATAYLFFPLLAAVYAKPVLNKLLTVWTTDNPKVEFKFKRYYAEIIGIDGNPTGQPIEIPTTELVRANDLKFYIEGNTSKSIVTVINENLPEGVTLDVKSNALRINLARAAITTVIWNNGDKDIEQSVLIRPDYNGEFKAQVSVDDGSGNKGTIVINGKFDTKSNEIFVSGTVRAGASGTVQYKGVRGRVGVIFLEDNRGIVKIGPYIEDVESFRIEPNNEMMIEADIFGINEYKDLYNVDYIASALDAVRAQLQLNKEMEIVDELSLAEPVMLQKGLVGQIDFDNPPFNIQPATVYDYFTQVVPPIVGLAKRIEKVSKVSPQYILAAPETAAFLEILRTLTVQFQQGGGQIPAAGVLGPAVASNLSYAKFQIIVSHALPEGKIYLVHKSNLPQYLTLGDFVYKPLIMADYTKKYKQWKYITTETKVRLLRPEFVGYIEFKGDTWRKLLGTVQLSNNA
jgi:hypothetical protein